MSKNVIQLRLYVKKRRKIETSPIEKVLWFCLYAIISPAAIVLRLSNLFAYYVIFWFGANEIIFISTPLECVHRRLVMFQDEYCVLFILDYIVHRCHLIVRSNLDRAPTQNKFDHNIISLVLTAVAFH